MRHLLLVASLLALLPAAAAATEGPTRSMGEALFASAELGSNGKSCADCHPQGKGLEELGAYDDGSLKEMVNFCIRDALAGRMFAPGSQELESMLLYLRSLTRAQ